MYVYIWFEKDNIRLHNSINSMGRMVNVLGLRLHIRDMPCHHCAERKHIEVFLPNA